ncbi:MAG: hypothetical protein M1816_002540 [Peltula sp. TS41687]|nr:MAG: hypothetical protein M1816_002540 [Peltula sp. TS41687]
MAESNSSGEGHQNLRLTPEEKRVFGQLFQAADTEGVGVVTGDVAVKFFEKSRLDPRILGEIWQIADTENRGFLTPAGFGVVLRLIGHVQNGRDPTPELAYRPGPLPRFDGFSKPLSSPPLPSPAANITPQSTGGPIRVPALTPDKVSEFSTLFEKSGAQNGMLGGAQAKQIFDRARLPYEILERIWNLADTQQNGALRLPEFIIAMHLLTSYKSGVMPSLPSILPPGLYDTASRMAQSQSQSPRGPIPSQRPNQGIPRQFSGNYPQQPQSPMRTASVNVPSMSTQATGNDWVVSPKDKELFDNIFTHTIDTTSKGFITGDEAVEFFGRTKLPAEVLAQIWDLACITGNGQLNKDEFAVAMYLIRQQRRPGSSALPTTLPPSLVPPSMRRQSVTPTPTAFSSFTETPSMLSKSAAEDLFGLDDLSQPASPQPQLTGGSSSINVNKSGPLHTSPQQAQQTSSFKPFVPSSSFGQTIVSSNLTGGSSASGPSQTRQPPLQQQRGVSVDDLLGDNDPEISKRLIAETAELANVSNQVNNLTQQTQDMKSRKQATETDLANVTSQKREYESKLAQLRTAYEREVQDVRNLEEQLNNVRNEIKRLLRDIAMVEGSYEDIKNQHRQASNALKADEKEKAELKEKIRKMNSEMDQLRSELEKLKLDSRQQKGLIAINKKQLSTSENERDRLKSEVEETSKAVDPISRRETSPAVATPALSATSQSTNPFFRNLPQTSQNPLSPASFTSDRAAPYQSGHGSFDDIFGPSSSQTPTVPPPPTSFRVESISKDVQTHPVKNEASGRFPSLEEEHKDLSPFDEPPSFSEATQPSSMNVPAHGKDKPMGHGEHENRNKDMTSEIGKVESKEGSKKSESSTFGSNDNQTSGDSKTEDHHTSPLSSFSPLKFFRGMIPGAFPGGGSDSPETQTPKEEDNIEDKNKHVELPNSEPNTKDEPAVKDDFDSAFADFDVPRGSPSNGDSSEQVLPKKTNNIDNEFPPIQELGIDDVSDSSSERKFDDDFTPFSPRKNGMNLDGAGDQEPSLSNSRPATLEVIPRADDQLPTPGAEVSPPSYKQSVSTDMGSGSDASHFPPEFTGLLPSREDPTHGDTPIASSVTTVDRNPLATMGSTTAATVGQALAPSVIQKTSPSPRETTQTSTPDGSYQLTPSYLQRTDKDQSQSSQVISVGQWEDDFDRDFTDLADAKEEPADEKDLVANQFGGSSEFGGGGSFDEFKPIFDSPEGSGINHQSR